MLPMNLWHLIHKAEMTVFVKCYTDCLFDSAVNFLPFSLFFICLSTFMSYFKYHLSTYNTNNSQKPHAELKCHSDFEEVKSESYFLKIHQINIKLNSTGKKKKEQTNADVSDRPTIYLGTFSNNVLFFANLTWTHRWEKNGTRCAS